MDWESATIESIISAALQEDVGSGDVAVGAAVSPSAAVEARIVAGRDLVCAGLPLVERILSRMDTDVSVEAQCEEGQKVSQGTSLLRLSGNAGAILSASQTVLNFLSRLSGIATLTHAYVEQVRGTRGRIGHTRETTPGLRPLEQYAVQVGGGARRHGSLFDAIVLREPHTELSGGIKAALDRAHSHASTLLNPAALTAYEATGTLPSGSGAASLPIQIQVCDESELREALAAGAESFLLVDVPPSEVRRLAEIAHGERKDCTVEVTGDIAVPEARAYAEAGADYIAPARLISSAPPARVRVLVDSLREK